MKGALSASRSFSDGHKRLSSLEIGAILLFICGFFLSLSVIIFIIEIINHDDSIWSFLGVLLLSIGFIAIVWGMRKIQTRGYVFDPPVVYDTVNRKSYSLPSPPGQMIFNTSNNSLYVALRDRIMVLDGTTDHMVDEIAIHKPRYFTINFVTNKLFVALKNGISVIDMSSNKVIKSIFEEYNYGQLCVNNNTNMLYAINKSYNNQKKSPNCVDVIDCSSFALISRIDTQWKPSGIAVNPSNNRIYAGFEKHPSVFVFDGSKNNTCISKIHLPKIDHSELESNNIYFDPSSDLLFVLQNRYYPGSGGPGGWGDFLLKIDTNVKVPDYFMHEFDCDILSKTERYLPRLRSKSVLKEDDIIRRNGGDSIILNPKTGLLYLTDIEKKKLDEIDINTNKILNTFEISDYSSAKALNSIANKLYLGSSRYFAESTIDIIYLENERAVKTSVPLHYSIQS